MSQFGLDRRLRPAARPPPPHIATLAARRSTDTHTLPRPHIRTWINSHGIPRRRRIHMHRDTSRSVSTSLPSLRMPSPVPIRGCRPRCVLRLRPPRAVRRVSAIAIESGSTEVDARNGTRENIHILKSVILAIHCFLYPSDIFLHDMTILHIASILIARSHLSILQSYLFLFLSFLDISSLYACFPVAVSNPTLGVCVRQSIGPLLNVK